MGCLDPPLVRQPARNREWFCPDCRAAPHAPHDSKQSSRSGSMSRGGSVSRGSTPRRLSNPTPRRVAARPPTPEEPSPYELQRLDNIARNQRVLEELGLAGPTPR